MSRRAILLVLMLFTLGAYAQDSTFLSRVVSSAAAQPSQEKVYLHLNKPSYYPGDTIWYKAYTVAGDRRRLSELSGVLYAELIGPKDSVIARQTLKLAAGIAWGEFSLSRKTGGGTYRVRAYTNWMRNQGTAGFYDHRFRVAGASFPVPEKQAPALRPDVQFFPEGGGLVAGMRSRVAFKAIGSNGLGVDISGTIMDNDGNVVTDLASQHLGMGVFALTPVPGKTYHAKITAAGEDAFTAELPKAAEAGFVLSVDNREKDSIYVHVSANDKLFEQSGAGSFYLVAQCGGKVYFTTRGQLTGQPLVAHVERSRFPSGVVQFTLFSKDGQPVNERAIFVDNDDKMKVEIAGVNAVSAPRQKIQVSLAAGDGKKLSSLSVSVINENRVPFNGNDESTILNHLLLTSDLKGYIEQPNYYFTDVNQKKLADLDALMLTQGYTRFDWQEVLTGTPASLAYAPENAMQLEGTLKTPSGKPVPKGKVTLAATRDNLVIDTVTDINGNFRFTGLDLSDTSKIVVRARKANDGSNLDIFVKQPDYPIVTRGAANGSALAPPTFEMNNAIAGYREEQVNDSLKNGRILNGVTIKGKKLPKPDEFNNHGALLEYDADMKKLRQEEVVTTGALTNVIPGLTYSDKHFVYHFKPIKSVIIDGFTHKADDIDFLSVKELESVRVIGISPSILVLTTKRYAGTDTTATTKLKEVTIRAKRTAKPDVYNHYGTVPENLVDMKTLNTEFNSVKEGITILVAGLHYFYIKGSPVLRYAHDTAAVRVIIDGFERQQGDIDTYSPKEIESIRLVQPTTFDQHPVLIITSKNYAGTDTTATVKLKTVTINAKKEKPKPDLSTSSNLHGGGNADQVIMADEMGNGPDLESRLLGKIKFVTFSNNGAPVNMRSMGKMAIIVDGITMTGGHLNEIIASDVYSVEVLRTTFAKNIYGSSLPGDGALVITTKRGVEPKYITSTAPAGLIAMPFKGYHVARVFYSPKYDHPKTGDDRFDSRTAIYWNPNIITGKEGKASFEYYNADTKGTYRIVVEGIDDDGEIGRQVLRYTVQ